MRRIFVLPFIGLIYVYKYTISPLLPRACRHVPSCSTYSIEALQRHGLIRGSFFAVNRIARCQPWGTSGYDPVPRILIKKIDFRKLAGVQGEHPSCDRLKDH
jgi:hypothetical protein